VISGYFQAPQPDEGAAAHIFQLSVLAFVAVMLVFLVTAGGKQRRWNVCPLLISGTALTFAFAALYYLEHYFYAQH
jgi:ABC-type Fe3+-siderophore transport system permease subunit